MGRGLSVAVLLVTLLQAAPTTPPDRPPAPTEPPRVVIANCPAELQPGLKAIRAEFPTRFAEAGAGRARAIRFEKAPAGAVDSLRVDKHDRDATVYYQRPGDAFRALGRLLGETGATLTTPFRERARYKCLGVTVDCSRNAVFTPAQMKSLLCRLALMGINTMVPYTEDTYAVPGEPFWGYLRGGYTFAELKSMDDDAFDLGIEMFLGVQTLGHLGQVLQWPAYASLADTENVILAQGEPTYALLEKALRAASAPFRSKRIHLGMDEAHGLGTGNYPKRFGPKAPFEIFAAHLDRLRAICQRLGLQPMMWSDMYFRLGSKTGDYYDPAAVVSQVAIDAIPHDVQALYWDYYHDDPAFYAAMIDRHRRIGIEPGVVCGVWSWARFWAALPHAFTVTDALMTAAGRQHVQEAYTSIWFDDGAECELYSALPAVQRFAEYGYSESVDELRLRANFFGATDTVYDDWVKACDIDAMPGSTAPAKGAANIAKPLLWDDPLIGIFTPQLEGVSPRDHYLALASALLTAAGRTPDSERLRFPALIARVLAYKCDLRRNLAAAYAGGDRDRLRSLASGDLLTLQQAVKELWQYHRAAWLASRKPFGWEVLEHRYGGLMARLDTVAQRVDAYLAGSVSSLPELEVELQKLYVSPANARFTRYPRLETPSIIK